MYIGLYTPSLEYLLLTDSCFVIFHSAGRWLEYLLIFVATCVNRANDSRQAVGCQFKA